MTLPAQPVLASRQLRRRGLPREELCPPGAGPYRPKAATLQAGAPAPLTIHSSPYLELTSIGNSSESSTFWLILSEPTEKGAAEPHPLLHNATFGRGIRFGDSEDLVSQKQGTSDMVRFGRIPDTPQSRCRFLTKDSNVLFCFDTSGDGSTGTSKLVSVRVPYSVD